MSLLRWAIVAVPAVVLLGFLSGASVANGDDSAWYRALVKPAVTPPPWLFPIAWTLLYILMGLALAIVLNARGARGRGLALALFAIQFVINLTWTPVFFGAHKVETAFLILAMIVTGVATTIAFGRIRSNAAWLMVPYLVWISFAGVLNWSIGQLNPNAAGLVPHAASLQIKL